MKDPNSSRNIKGELYVDEGRVYSLSQNLENHIEIEFRGYPNVTKCEELGNTGKLIFTQKNWQNHTNRKANFPVEEEIIAVLDDPLSIYLARKKLLGHQVLCFSEKPGTQKLYYVPIHTDTATNVHNIATIITINKSKFEDLVRDFTGIWKKH